MIGIIVTGTLLILVVLYALIDGTIFQEDSEETKTIRVESELENEKINKGEYDCP